MKIKTKISLIIGSAFVLGGCIKDDQFSVVPVIKFEEYQTFLSPDLQVDSAKYVFSFQDGDGDIGRDDLSEVDCFLIYQEKNGEEVTNFPDVPNREYNLPKLTPNARDKSIEGEITLILKPAPIFNVLTDSSYRYACYIIDRAGNESDTIYSSWTSK